MNKYHSSMSRRDFMKAIGVTGAGIGAAAALAPTFHDLDEMAAAGVGYKRPWWAKVTDTPTTEIDWQQMKKYSEGNTMRGKGAEYLATYIDKAEQDRRAAAKTEAVKAHKAAKDPGYTARDYAFSGNASRGLTSNGFENWKTASTPEKLGLPKWEGSPEENAAVVRSFLRFNGMLSIGFTRLETDTTMKLMYEYGPNNREKYTFADVDTPSYTSGKEQVYPNKCKWVITVVNQESQELWKRNPYPLQVQIRYPRAQWIQEQFQGFMTSLGYYALSEGGNGTGIAPAFGVMSGLGEMGRMNRMITPEWGPTVGIFRYVTDLPLPDDKPINAGFLEFCKTCKKCAEACVEGAHSFEKEPTWEVSGPWNNPGHKAWFEDSRKCRAYQSLPDTCNAGTCLAVCTFTKYEKAGIHNLVKGIASTTPVFNGFFRQMDDFMGYGLKDPGSFWDICPPIYGVENTVGYDY